MKKKCMISSTMAIMILVLLYGYSLAGDNKSEPGVSSSWNFSSRLLTNEIIEEMMDSISGDRIYANVETLVSFYTRHTNSDTLSGNTGVGAARRWIYSRFEAFANDPGTYFLDPSYFTFNASVCGIYGQHRNILATLTGTVTPERFFIAMGHMDSRTNNVCNSTAFAPSANDDGSGTAIMVELARVMSKYQFESTPIIMAVTGEDQGLYGSTAYANWAQSQGMDIGAALTNDVVGNIEGCVNPACPPGEPVIIDSMSVRHFSGGPETGVARQLTRYMKLKAIEYMDRFTVNLIPAIDRPGRSGDHVPFYNRGWAGVRFTESHEYGDGSGSNGRQHNAYDTVSVINTNAGYMANIARLNIAGIASLAMAPVPPSGLQAEDAGNGTSVILTWPDLQTEPDFAGYRVAVRPAGGLFYSDVVDAGNVNEFLLTGLTDGQPVYIGISAYDNDDNESVFSAEISFTPSSVPQPPTGFEATSQQDGIQLNWIPNEEIDIENYKIYRLTPGQTEPDLIQILQHPTSNWFDNTAQSHNLYEYNITAVDSSQMESDFSETAYGQIASHDMGIIIIDGTLNGSGGPLQPTDEQVDDFYAELTGGFNIGAQWDILDSISVDINILDAHLAPYSVALYHSDRVNASHTQDTTAVKKYLNNGGKLLLSGWNLANSFGGVVEDFYTFETGSFFNEYLKVDSLGVSPASNQDFISALSLMPSIYPDLTIDSVKVPIFNNRLIKMDAFLSPLFDEPVTERLYTYNSSLGNNFRLHGEPVGFRYIGSDFQVVVFDVPLYFINQQSAGSAIRQALTDLGEEYTSADDSDAIIKPEHTVILSCYPNPFNSRTSISFNISGTSETRLSIYNLLGQETEVLANKVYEPGQYSITWNAADYPSGIYYCRLRGDGYSDNVKLVLIK